MARHGWKGLEMAKMAGNGLGGKDWKSWKLLEMVGKRLEMAGYSMQELGGNGCKWQEIIEKSWKML